MTQKVSEMAVKPVEKITRERLRAMRNGDTITTQCADGYDMDSQKKHGLRYAEDGKLPLCLQKRWATVIGYALWCQLNQYANRIDATASARRQSF